MLMFAVINLIYYYNQIIFEPHFNNQSFFKFLYSNQKEVYITTDRIEVYIQYN